jgi:hypothetical protein
MKVPKDSPTAIGERVVLRGRGASGVVSKIDEGGWVWVDWDEGVRAPKICFVSELAKQ